MGVNVSVKDKQEVAAEIQLLRALYRQNSSLRFDNNIYKIHRFHYSLNTSRLILREMKVKNLQIATIMKSTNNSISNLGKPEMRLISQQVSSALQALYSQIDDSTYEDSKLRVSIQNFSTKIEKSKGHLEILKQRLQKLKKIFDCNKKKLSELEQFPYELTKVTGFLDSIRNTRPKNNDDKDSNVKVSSLIFHCKNISSIHSDAVNCTEETENTDANQTQSNNLKYLYSAKAFLMLDDRLLALKNKIASKNALEVVLDARRKKLFSGIAESNAKQRHYELSVVRMLKNDKELAVRLQKDGNLLEDEIRAYKAEKRYFESRALLKSLE